MSVTPQMSSASPFQYVPVPNEHVPAVLSFIAELLTAPGETGSSIEATPATVIAETHDDGWTDEKLLKFSTMGTKTSETVSRILDLLSEESGKKGARSTRELADALNLDYFVLKAVPTQVSRTLGKHFDGLHSPYWGLWGTSDFTPSRSNEMYFAVTPERAEQWKRLRGSAE